MSTEAGLRDGWAAHPCDDRRPVARLGRHAVARGEGWSGAGPTASLDGRADRGRRRRLRALPLRRLRLDAALRSLAQSSVLPGVARVRRAADLDVATASRSAGAVARVRCRSATARTGSSASGT